MKAITTLMTVLFMAIIYVDVVLCAPVYHANSMAESPVTALEIKRAEALGNVYAPAGAVPGQPPGVVPTAKRDIQLAKKSEELEDCAAPCDFYIRSVETDAVVDAYAPGGAVPGQPPGVVPTAKRDIQSVKKSDELEDCAAPCDFYIRSVETDAAVDAYAPKGAVPGQPPGVVPTAKRDIQLAKKSDELEDCAAPCDFYIRSVGTADTSTPAYAVPGTVSPILPRKIVPVGYHSYVDSEAPTSKRVIGGAVDEAASYYWPPGFKGPRSKRVVGGSLIETTSSSSPRPGFTGPRSESNEAKVPLNPASGGYASGAAKRFEAKVPLNPASGGYASGAPKRSEIDT